MKTNVHNAAPLQHPGPSSAKAVAHRLRPLRNQLKAQLPLHNQFKAQLPRNPLLRTQHHWREHLTRHQALKCLIRASLFGL